MNAPRWTRLARSVRRVLVEKLRRREAPCDAAATRYVQTLVLRRETSDLIKNNAAAVLRCSSISSLLFRHGRSRSSSWSCQCHWLSTMHHNVLRSTWRRCLGADRGGAGWLGAEACVGCREGRSKDGADPVKQNGSALYHASAALKDDQETVRIAVAQNGLALKYASAVLLKKYALLPTAKGLPKTVRATLGWRAVASEYLANSAAMESADEGTNRADTMTAVEQNGLALQCATAAVKDDLETVRIAVAQDGQALQYASAALKDDSKTVRIAVAQFGWVLQYASAAVCMHGSSRPTTSTQAQGNLAPAGARFDQLPE